MHTQREPLSRESRGSCDLKIQIVDVVAAGAQFISYCNVADAAKNIRRWKIHEIHAS